MDDAAPMAPNPERLEAAGAVVRVVPGVIGLRCERHAGPGCKLEAARPAAVTRCATRPNRSLAGAESGFLSRAMHPAGFHPPRPQKSARNDAVTLRPKAGNPYTGSYR